jgi:hypothetical protein
MTGPREVSFTKIAIIKAGSAIMADKIRANIRSKIRFTYFYTSGWFLLFLLLKNTAAPN